jgi:asparagine synthase (glutamine-hydrolysing)
VGDHFSQRPKTPFFFGEDLRYTRRLLYNLLCAERNALVEEALEEGAHLAGVINTDALWHLFRRLPEDPEYTNVDVVLDLVNMSLLAAMAKAEPEPADSIALPVREVVIDEWGSLGEHLGVSLIQRLPTLDRNSVLRFADGVRVVKSEAGDRRLVDAEEYYILRNNDLEFTIEPHLESWVKFLRQVNGTRSVDQILRRAGVAEGEIWKHLEEAVEYDILNVVAGLSEETFVAGHRCREIADRRQESSQRALAT